MSILDKWLVRPDERTQLIASVQLGELCKTWAASGVGAYVVGMAEQYEIDVMRELAITKPDDQKKIMQLQERVKVPALLLQWLDDAISEGETARYQLQQEE